MMKRNWLLWFFWCGLLCGQDDPCVLAKAKTGDLVKVRAEVFPTGHDVFIRLVACKEDYGNPVILVWGDDPSLSTGTAPVRKDEAYLRYKELVMAKYPLPPNGMGVGQSRYRIVADFEGKLEVAPSAGLRRDPKTKKLIMEGFGHPTPFSRYRLVASSVSEVEAREQPPVSQHEVEHAVKPDPAKRQ